MARTREGATVARFYQLEGTPLERALAMLAGKAYERGLRVAVAAGDRLEALDRFLWVWPVDSFLPHGPAGGPQAKRQPVLLCSGVCDDNGASLLINGGGVEVAEPGRFDMILEFVDAQGGGVNAGRARYRRYRELGCVMEYWVQGEGGWQLRG